MSDDERDYRRREKFYSERMERGGYTAGDNPPPDFYRDYDPPGGWRDRLPPPVNLHGPGPMYRTPPPPRGYQMPPPPLRRDFPPSERIPGGPPVLKRSRRLPEGGEDAAPPPPERMKEETDAAFRSAMPRKIATPAVTAAAAAEKADKDGYQPVMMSFKAFLETQDDTITDEESLVKYAEYKLEFKRQQLNQFFVLHRDEEWFKVKYHPKNSQEIRDHNLGNLKKRLDIFGKLNEQGMFDALELTEEAEQRMIRIMDTFVLKLDDTDAALIDEYIAKTSAGEEDDLPVTPRTSSIFLRTLHPSVTKEEVETVCRKYPGFLRISISDPVSDKNWMRKAWLTFKRNSKVKEICFNLNNLRINDHELGPVVNKDLSKRIRSVPGFLNDRRVMKADISMAAKLISTFDRRWGFWTSSEGSDINTSSNPLLRNVHDFLVEEVSAEEEELLGQGFNGGSEDAEVARPVDVDPQLATALDKLILYLRFVYSIDFYNRTEYMNEDEMPNKCGIFHLRGGPTGHKIRADEIERYNSETAAKFESLLKNKTELSDQEVHKLGVKSEQDEIEKFVLANCQELAKDKWLCPLSGKKFKAPEYVRKHIFNKFSDKVTEVKVETEYFNKYLRDPNRPELPVPPPAKPRPKKPTTTADEDKQPGAPRELLVPKRRVPVKERLGIPVGVAGIKVTHATRDPRDIVDYSDIDLANAFDIF